MSAAFAVTLRSGSSGNCVLVSDGEAHILIDCGLSLRALTAELKPFGLTPSGLSAIFLTHEHSDHTKLLHAPGRDAPARVTASRGTLEAARVHKNASVIEAAQSVKPTPGGRMTVTRFDTSHDAAESCGYVVEFGGHRVGVCTDLGRMTDRVLNALSVCEYVILESNHDADMLKSGPYPLFLRRRILSGVGHLSNSDCARAVARLAASGTRRVTLAHLSEENNDPSLAIGASCHAVSQTGAELGKDIQIDAAPRLEAGEMYCF